MDIKQLLEEERTIWGNKPQSLEYIAVCMGKIYGDICRQVRSQIETGSFDETELKKELGNMIASTVRWIDDLDFDADECLQLALASQKAYRKSVS